jgi:hypothetical protein
MGRREAGGRCAAAKTKTQTPHAKRFADATKHDAVRMLRDGVAATEVAEKYNTTATTIWAWRKQGWGGTKLPDVPAEPVTNGHASNGHAAPVADAPTSLFELSEDLAGELARVQAENAELRSLLKKLL